MIRLKRAYDPSNRDDGTRILVERLWPRGIKKTSLKIEEWNKEVAPSTELRKWFSHDPAKWKEFRRNTAVLLLLRAKGGNSTVFVPLNPLVG